MPARGREKRMRATAILVITALAAALAAPARAETIGIATWNMANLHHVPGEPLRPGAAARTEAHYATLRTYRDRLEADLVAFQEVNGPKAAGLVLPPREWELLVDGRYVDDLVAGRDSDRIYTGFAVRRGVFDAVSKRDVRELSVTHGPDGRPVRWGTELLVEKGAARLLLLAVHLKAGCAQGSLESPTDPDCATLAAQRAPLEGWIDAAAEGTVPFVVLGDFNRAFDRFGDDDRFWQEIDDGEPAGLDLWRLPFRQESDCWRGTGRHHPRPIDFLVFDDRAWRWVDRARFRQVSYDAADQDEARGTPSDHCPIAVDLRLE
jgi:endonuclease/exonuclease/phosphatase family metal-dependent hydrolase